MVNARHIATTLYCDTHYMTTCTLFFKSTVIPLLSLAASSTTHSACGETFTVSTSSRSTKYWALTSTDPSNGASPFPSFQWMTSAAPGNSWSPPSQVTWLTSLSTANRHGSKLLTVLPSSIEHVGISVTLPLLACRDHPTYPKVGTKGSNP